MIGIYADARRSDGLGHARRCQALAEALARRGGRPVFLAENAETRANLRGLGLSARPWAAAARFDLLIVDSYRAERARWKAFRRSARVLAAIDDGQGPRTACDWLINTGISAALTDYGAGLGALNLALGPRYHLLPSRLRKIRPGMRGPGRVRTLLVTLGGAPSEALVRSVVAAARAALPSARLRVTADAPLGAPPADYLGTRADMAAEITRCDAAVCAAGQTIYELAHAGKPAAAFAVSRNQLPNLTGFSAFGAVLSAGSADSKDFHRRLGAELSRMAKSSALRARLAAAGRRIIDGKGADRLADLLLHEVKP